MLVKTCINEVGFYQLLQGQTPSLTRIGILLECFNTTKTYISWMLTAMPVEMVSWSQMDWRMLNYGVMVNSRAATIIDSFCYSPESMDRASWIDTCYSALCEHIASLLRSGHRDGSHVLARVASDWENARLAYHKTVQQALTQASASAGAVNASAAQQDFAVMDNMYNMGWQDFADMGGGGWSSGTC
jgi:hypothetical protein